MLVVSVFSQLDPEGGRQIWVCFRHLRHPGVRRPLRSHIHLCNICNTQTKLLITLHADLPGCLMKWRPTTPCDVGQQANLPSSENMGYGELRIQVHAERTQAEESYLRPKQ